MGNVFLTANVGTRYKILERYERVYFRHLGFVALLHGGNHNAFYAFRLKNFALREPAIHKRDLIKTYFHGFFHKPFGSIHVFCGSHGKMQMTLPRAFGFSFVQDTVLARSRRNTRNLGIIKISAPIGYDNPVSLCQAQHLYCMTSLLDRQFAQFTTTGHIEVMYFFHRSSNNLCKVS